MTEKIFDDITFPIFVCGDGWRIEYKNKAAVFSMNTLRKGSALSRIFMVYENRAFSLPKSNGIRMIDTDARYGYCKAACFAYEDKAIVVFPDIFIFETLSYDYLSIIENMSSGLFLRLIKASEPGVNPTNRMLSKLKNDMYSALNASFNEGRKYNPRPYFFSVCSVYELIERIITQPFSKYGGRIQFDTSLLPADHSVYTDAKKLSLMFMQFLFFCTKIACDGKCLIKVSLKNDKIKNEFIFRLGEVIKSKSEKLSVTSLMRFSPSAYASFAVFETACEKFGWSVDFTKDKNDAKLFCLSFEAPTQDKYSDLFRSDNENDDTERIIEYIVSKAIGLI